MLCELEPWQGVTFFEQPGKTSLRSKSTRLIWAQSRSTVGHITWSGPFVPLTTISAFLRAGSICRRAVSGKESKVRSRGKGTQKTQ